jgi:cytochrome P450
MRWSMREHTFSDGTYVPAGTFLAVPSAPLHHDSELYDNACEMDPFRFEKPKEDNLTRRQFTSTDFEYLAFGHGKLLFLIHE